MDNYNDDQFDIQLRQDLEQARNAILNSYNSGDGLLDFDFYAGYESSDNELSALNSIKYCQMHTYNLILLIFFFIIAKWLFDKTILAFNSLWKGF